MSGGHWKGESLIPMTPVQVFQLLRLLLNNILPKWGRFHSATYNIPSMHNNYAAVTADDSQT